MQSFSAAYQRFAALSLGPAASPRRAEPARTSPSVPGQRLAGSRSWLRALPLSQCPAEEIKVAPASLRHRATQCSGAASSCWGC